MDAPAILLDFPGAPFGITGQSEASTVLSARGHAPELVGEVVLSVATAAWLAVLTVHVLDLRSTLHARTSDLVDPVAAPFPSLAVTTPMLLARLRRHSQALTPGTVPTGVFPPRSRGCSMTASHLSRLPL